MKQLTFDLAEKRIEKRLGRKPVGRVEDDGRECAECVVFKPWSAYSLSASGVRGHNSICRECRSRRRAVRIALRDASNTTGRYLCAPDNGDAPARYTGVIPLHYGNYVYRCWTADDVCIYIGRTRHVVRRLGSHARLTWWQDVHHVDVAVMAGVAAADAEEIAQIRHWRPVNNSAYNRTFAKKSRKPKPTHCPQNHEYTDSNTIYNANGSKVCRTCKNEKARAKPKKGIARGENAASSKLTAAAVADIRRRRALGKTISALSRDYGVARSSIRNVVNGRTWTHVREDPDEPAMSFR